MPIIIVIIIIIIVMIIISVMSIISVISIVLWGSSVGAWKKVEGSKGKQNTLGLGWCRIVKLGEGRKENK